VGQKRGQLFSRTNGEKKKEESTSAKLGRRGFKKKEKNPRVYPDKKRGFAGLKDQARRRAAYTKPFKEEKRSRLETTRTPKGLVGTEREPFRKKRSRVEKRPDAAG